MYNRTFFIFLINFQFQKKNPNVSKHWERNWDRV